jgi:hypothetical protein
MGVESFRFDGKRALCDRARASPGRGRDRRHLQYGRHRLAAVHGLTSTPRASTPVPPGSPSAPTWPMLTTAAARQFDLPYVRMMLGLAD